MALTRASARPIMALIGYSNLSVLAFSAAHGWAQYLPEWFLEFYIAGTAVNMLGWQIVRQLEKNKAAQ